MYANSDIKNFVTEKEIKESILFPNPVPSNIEEVPSLDDFMKELLHGKSQTTDMQIKNTLKLQ